MTTKNFFGPMDYDAWVSLPPPLPSSPARSARPGPRQRGQIRVSRLNQIQSRSESARSIRVSQLDPSRPSQPVRPEPVATRVRRVNPSQPA